MRTRRDFLRRKNVPSVEMHISGNERIWRVGTATAMNNHQRIWSGRFDAAREYGKRGLQNRRHRMLRALGRREEALLAQLRECGAARDQAVAAAGVQWNATLCNEELSPWLACDEI